MKLIAKLVAGIIAGIFIGLAGIDWITRLAITFKDVFGEFINFVIPLIILFFIASGISKLGNESGKLLGISLGAAYTSTLIAGIGAFFVATFIMPFIASGGAVPEEGKGLEGFLTFEIEPLMGVITALVLAFVFGVGIAKLNSQFLMKVFDEGKSIIELVIVKIIIPLLPFYIAGIFAELAAAGTVFNTLKVFGIVLVVAVLTHWVWLFILYTIAGTYNKRNPFSLLKTMLPAFFTALGTMSSAATIPVTLRQTKENGVREEIANFSIPLNATIHLSGSTITITSCSIAVMAVLDGYSIPGFSQMLPFILMLGVVMIAAPGVPGGAVMAATGILASMLGFDKEAIGLMIALYMAQDSFGTATNVTGDGALALIIDKFMATSKK
ncbi:dicarboxylate/amino acid:cation symporter [Thermoactinomyces mirandus]|uniref:Dicarboxylate/amino acid:cation symporter n=1 Tax=Thermoactinomyces mirandus TaxID=2756294 RepID=A0A7W1XRS1_9BACL|nr:dicarboxylate/amino acid:cation symporter [Thermoactinomyces mirandus]MBA4602112.1 dicarboxylate/amino acid:cation symporter [Thermoactinomyces mirandus]